MVRRDGGGRAGAVFFLVEKKKKWEDHDLILEGLGRVLLRKGAEKSMILQTKEKKKRRQILLLWSLKERVLVVVKDGG